MVLFFFGLVGCLFWVFKSFNNAKDIARVNNKATHPTIMTTKLSDHFPAKPKQCLKESEAFFKCFEDQSKAAVESSNPKNCLSLMESYDACLLRYCKSKPLKRVRVNSMYRVEQE